MASLFDLAKMNVSTAPGTGSTIALGTAAAIGGITFLTFAQAGATNGVIVDYSILDVNGVETGTAIYSTTGPSLTSRTPTTSSNANAAINASAASTVSISPRAATLANAALFTTGTLADARLSSNVPLKNANNAFTANMSIGGNFALGGGNAAGWNILGNYGAAATVANTPSTASYFISSDGGWAGYTFHRSGAYAVNFGLDTNNDIVVGGWSDGAVNRIAISTAGNLTLKSGGVVAPASLGSNTPDFSKILRGDSAWVTNGRVLLGSYSASNSATLQDTTIFTTYGAYFPNFEIVYDNIVNQTTNRPLVLEVYQGGAFKTSGYQGYTIGTSATGYAPSTWVPLTANGAAAFPLNGYSGTARCYNPTGGGVVNWTNQSTGVVAGLAHVQSGGGAWLTAAAIAGFRIRFDSGNIVSGIVRVYGIA